MPLRAVPNNDGARALRVPREMPVAGRITREVQNRIRGAGDAAQRKAGPLLRTDTRILHRTAARRIRAAEAERIRRLGRSGRIGPKTGVVGKPGSTAGNGVSDKNHAVPSTEESRRCNCSALPAPEQTRRTGHVRRRTKPTGGEETGPGLEKTGRRELGRDLRRNRPANQKGPRAGRPAAARRGRVFQVGAARGREKDGPGRPGRTKRTGARAGESADRRLDSARGIGNPRRRRKKRNQIGVPKLGERVPPGSEPGGSAGGGEIPNGAGSVRKTHGTSAVAGDWTGRATRRGGKPKRTDKGRKTHNGGRQRGQNTKSGRKPAERRAYGPCTVPPRKRRERGSSPPVGGLKGGAER